MTDALRGGGPIYDPALLARVGASGIRYVRIIAPAGFGKSTLARVFSRLHADTTTEFYDCHDIGDITGAGSVFEDWSRRGGAPTHVFDHLESVVAQPHAVASIKALLRRLAPESRAILLSRSPLPGTLCTDAAPHEILTITHQDLQFGIADLHRAFAAATLDDASLAELMRVTRGWPAAVLFLLRFIRSEEDTPILLDLTAPGLRVFLDYVLEEVVLPLSPANLETLVACATLPHASYDDVAAALGIDAADARLDDLSAAFPLIGYHANATIALHPLVIAALRATHAGWIERSVARAVDTHIERGAMVAAARMYLELGRPDDAAEALGRATIDFQTTQQTFEGLAAELDDTVVCASPALWNIMFPFRRYRRDPQVLLREADRLLSASLLKKTGPLQAGIVACMALILCDVGDLDRALALCTALEERASEDGVNVEAHTNMAQAVVMSYEGRFSESLALWQRAGLSMSFSAFPTSRQLRIEARAARARGLFDIEAELHRRHLNLAQRSGTAVFEAMALTEAAFSAWFAGRDDLVFEHASTYRRDVPRALGYCFNEFFLNVSARPNQAAIFRGSFPRINAYGELIRSGMAKGDNEKMRYAQLAKEDADHCNDGLLMILARVTLSYLEPQHRERLLREALEIAAPIESLALSAAIEALTAGPSAHAGMLEPLARRYRRVPTEANDAVVRIDVLQGRVSRNGNTLGVSTGTIALLVVLALQRRAASRDVLCSMLWPDSEPEDAGNALKMCVRRLRSQLEDFGIIEWTKAGYALRADTLVDIARVFPAVEGALSRNSVVTDDAPALRSMFDALTAGRPAFMTAWQWFEPTERRLCNTARELGVLLATAAFERKDDADCLAVSEQLLAADACDETAHELRIRLRVRAGDRAAAVRAFDSYRALLKRELGIEPRADFAGLFERSVANHNGAA